MNPPKKSVAVDHKNLSRSGRKLKMGRVILLEQRQRFRSAKGYSAANHRLREVETLIRHRHGHAIPKTDDAEFYIRVAAHALRVALPDDAMFRGALESWCGVFAPWALVRRQEIIEPIINETLHRAYNLSQRRAAELLALRWRERVELSNRTIAACDVSPQRQKELAKELNRKRARERRTQIRRAAGAQTRERYLSNSLSRTKPWKLEGISRRTWYRRKKRPS
ncbi:MAG: hypothetical protein AAF468_18995 [Pseudomonadota bacterium]